MSIFEDKIRVAVIPAFSGAGASFVSQALALGLAEEKTGEISLIETAGASFFHAMGLEAQYLARAFQDYSLALEKGEPIKGIRNERAGLNCLFRIPGKSPDLTVPRLFRLLASAPGDLQIFDFSGMEQALIADAAAECEVRILVIDPLPIKLIEACRFISDFLIRFPDTVLVVNKMNPGVHKKELKGFLAGKKYIEFPHLDPQLIYKAQYCSMLPCMLKETLQQLQEPVNCVKKILLSGLLT